MSDTKATAEKIRQLVNDYEERTGAIVTEMRVVRADSDRIGRTRFVKTDVTIGITVSGDTATECFDEGQESMDLMALVDGLLRDYENLSSNEVEEIILIRADAINPNYRNSVTAIHLIIRL